MYNQKQNEMLHNFIPFRVIESQYIKHKITISLRDFGKSCCKKVRIYEPKGTKTLYRKRLACGTIC